MEFSALGELLLLLLLCVAMVWKDELCFKTELFKLLLYPIVANLCEFSFIVCFLKGKNIKKKKKIVDNLIYKDFICFTFPTSSK